MATTTVHTDLDSLERAINGAENLSPLGRTVLRRLYGLDAAGKAVSMDRIASDLGITRDAALRIARAAAAVVRPLL